ncbi:MAG: CheR family methyltransferase [bacterium]
MMELDNKQNYGLYNALHEIFDRRGFNFKEYGIARIQQKLTGRMSTLEISDLYSYIEYIKFNPEEYNPLFNAILINQNQFFRDPQAYDFIKIHVLPKLLFNNSKQDIRVWSVGCGSGEEPYSVAILLSEILKKDIGKYKIKIFATDIDESAIKIARSRIYHADKLVNLPQFVKDNYFTNHGDLYTISEKIRNMVIFGKHNITSDPPIPYVDLLICRDVLIYLEPTQRLRAIMNICNALNYNGYLWMGLAENHINKEYYGLKPLSTTFHVFKKISQIFQQNSDLLGQSNIYTTKVFHNNIETKKDHKLYMLLLDENYKIVYYDQNFGRIFSQFENNLMNTNYEKDLSKKTIFDLSISHYIPDLKVRLDSTDNTNQPYSIIDNFEYPVDKDERILLKVIIVRIKDNQLDKSRFVLIFLDVTDQYELNNELQITISALDMANKKLLSTNEELKAMAKGLETINQYLQSANTEEFIELNEYLVKLNTELNALKESYSLLIRNVNSGIIIVDEKLSIKLMNSIAKDILDIQNIDIKMSLTEIDTELAKLAEQVIKNSDSKNYILKLTNKSVDVSINPITYENNYRLFLILNERVEIPC